MKKGADFELLVKAVYEEILSQDAVKTIAVEHDVKIKGKSGQAHQIDVYWEFDSAGITHKVAVECKDYKSTVSVGKVRDFYGAINDIGNIHGVFVTTEGYQAGAIKFAKHHGISLKIVSEPTEQELDDSLGIKSVVLRGDILLIKNVERTYNLDTRWIIENTDLRDEIKFSGMNNEIKILDKNYNSLGTLLDFENKLSRRPENTVGLSHTYSFEEDAFIYIPESDYPPLKILSLRYDYDTCSMQTEIVSTYKAMAQAILKDILTGENHLYKFSVQAIPPI